MGTVGSYLDLHSVHEMLQEGVRLRLSANIHRMGTHREFERPLFLFQADRGVAWAKSGGSMCCGNTRIATLPLSQRPSAGAINLGGFMRIPNCAEPGIGDSIPDARFDLLTLRRCDLDACPCATSHFHPVEVSTPQLPTPNSFNLGVLSPSGR
jgi:hypothetical protein